MELDFNAGSHNTTVETIKNYCVRYSCHIYENTILCDKHKEWYCEYHYKFHMNPPKKQFRPYNPRPFNRPWQERNKGERFDTENRRENDSRFDSRSRFGDNEYNFGKN